MRQCISASRSHCEVVGVGRCNRSKRGSPRQDTPSEPGGPRGGIVVAKWLVEEVLERVQSVLLTFSMMLSSVVVGGCCVTA